MNKLCIALMVGLVGCASGEIQQSTVDGTYIESGNLDGGLPSGAECQPGERRCQGTVKTQTCRDNGTWAVPRNCVRAMCVEGVCKRSQADCGPACTVGEQRCSGPSEIQTCRSGDNGCGEWAEPSACPMSQICDPGTNQCSAGTCDSVCTAGGTQCAGAQVMVCSRCRSRRCW